MLKTSTKLSVFGAASLFGAALFAGGAYAAPGSTTAAAPGQVLQVSGGAPAPGHARAVATSHANAHANANANANAKGLFSASPVGNSDTIKVQSHATARPMPAGHTSVTHVVRSAPRPLPTHHAVTSGTSASRSTSCSDNDHHTTSAPGTGHDMMR